MDRPTRWIDTFGVDRLTARQLDVCHYHVHLAQPTLIAVVSLIVLDELEEKREVLAKLQALNKNIIDSITSGIITTDLEGRITFMNRGAEEITMRRLGATEGVGVDVFLMREPDFLSKVKANVDRERRCAVRGRVEAAEGVFGAARRKRQFGQGRDRRVIDEQARRRGRLRIGRLRALPSLPLGCGLR